MESLVPVLKILLTLVTIYIGWIILAPIIVIIALIVYALIYAKRR